MNSLKNTTFRPKNSRKFTNISYLSPSNNYNNLHFVSIFGKLMTFFAHRGGVLCNVSVCIIVLIFSSLQNIQASLALFRSFVTIFAKKVFRFIQERFT